MRVLQPLQPGETPPSGAAYLRADPTTTIWGRLPGAADEPVLTVEDGAVVVVDTVSHEGLLPDQGGDPLAYFTAHGVPPQDVLTDAVVLARDLDRDPATDGPHLVTGPIAVRGAQPGDLVRVTLLEAQPRVPYGVVSNRHGRGALPGEFPQGTGDVSVFIRMDDGAGHLPLVPGGPAGVRFPLEPFLGLVGVVPAEGGRLHSVPPGPHGGNLDIRLTTVGASFLLPVQVPDAMVYLGDPHGAQGDGEVALTALEASLRATVRLEVVPRGRALAEYGDRRLPLVETPDAIVPTGLDPDLDEAVRISVREAIDLLGARYGMAPHLALAYLSAAADVRISQVVDQVCGAHVVLPRAHFDAVESGS
ncbi:acetamidase/formamidase family protein [Salana multivorans]